MSVSDRCANILQHTLQHPAAIHRLCHLRHTCRCLPRCQPMPFHRQILHGSMHPAVQPSDKSARGLDRVEDLGCQEVSDEDWTLAEGLTAFCGGAMLDEMAQGGIRESLSMCVTNPIASLSQLCAEACAKHDHMLPVRGRCVALGVRAMMQKVSTRGLMVSSSSEAYIAIDQECDSGSDVCHTQLHIILAEGH